MRILFLHSSSDTYGSGKILCYVVRTLYGAGCECHVILPEDGPLAEELKSLGAKVSIEELGILRRKYYTFTGICNRLSALFSAVVMLRRYIATRQIEIVYSNTTAVLAGAIAARLMRKKHIWHVHEIIAKPKLLAVFIAVMLKYCSDKVVVVSQSVYDHWNDIRPMQDKLVLIYNGLDAARFRDVKPNTLRTELGFSNDLLLIGMVGRVHYWKGQDYFLKIAQHIHGYSNSVRFIMAGDPFPGYEYLLDIHRRLKKEYALENVLFDLGFRTDVMEIMASLDIFILPSTLPDPLPTVVLEAMFSSKPVVATAHGGATEMVIDGQTGVLIPWDNAALAFAKIKPLIDNSSIRRRMGEQGRVRAEQNYSLKTFEENIKKLISNYQKTCA
jgi:glycosyltransferase involved in cell wall biosynthesis